MNIARVLMLPALLLGAAAHAGDFDIQLDARIAVSDSRTSFLDGGLGKLRYGEGGDGLKVGRIRMAYRTGIGEIAHLTIDASAWSVADTNPVDLTEAFVELRPVPSSAWRSRIKLGAFYAPISLEHRASGWTNPYTLSSSALNTWVGEELRTIGAQYELDWLGSRDGGAFDLGLTVAAYGWNDPAGVVIALRGFALHDRQTPLFGRLRTHVEGGPESRVIFEEIDDRPGYYLGVKARHAGGTELRFLHYDNRADPAAFDASIQDYAWETLFNSIGLRHESPSGWTLIGQWLDGVTYVGPGRHDAWDFDSAFLLVARQVGRHRLAARVEQFAMNHTRTTVFPSLSRDRGTAWTLGWSFEPRERLELSAEILQVRSDVAWRAQLGEPSDATEDSLQLGVRYSFPFSGR